MNAPKFPHIKVQFIGEDGNAFFIIGRVRKALRQAGVSGTEADEFVEQAMLSRSYDGVLQTVMQWVDVA